MCGYSLSAAEGTRACYFGFVWEMEGTLASGAAAGAVDGGGRQVGPILKIVQTAHSAKQQLATVREVKNFLVGNEQAKHAALGLSVVEDILTFLDAGAAAASSRSNRHCYKSSLLHGIGLLGILNSPPLPRGLAEKHLAPSGSRVLGHIVRALEMTSSSTTATSDINGSSSNTSSSGERLTATALRAISSLCACLAPPTTTGTTTCIVDVAAEAGCTATSTTTATVVMTAAKEEGDKSFAVLKKASVLILNEIVATTTTENIARGRGRSSQSSRCWSASLTTLGLKALAAITRVHDLARSLVQQVVSTEAVLLAPIW